MAIQDEEQIHHSPGRLTKEASACAFIRVPGAALGWVPKSFEMEMGTRNLPGLIFQAKAPWGPRPIIYIVSISNGSVLLSVNVGSC